MREIKFRGKRKDDGEWVHGYYAVIENKHIIIDDGRFQDAEGTIHRGSYFEVIPETVGQFTGLLDRNGKEIYEGDIVRGIWQVNHKDVREGVVNYWEKFGLYGLNDNSSLVSIVWSGCEVIGNIHENPELLK